MSTIPGSSAAAGKEKSGNDTTHCGVLFATIHSVVVEHFRSLLSRRVAGRQSKLECHSPGLVGSEIHTSVLGRQTEGLRLRKQGQHRQQDWTNKTLNFCVRCTHCAVSNSSVQNL